MGARAAKTVIKIEMPERGIEIVSPQQADHAAAKPNAFGVASRAAKRALRFGVFVDFIRVFAGFLTGGRGFVGRFGVFTLREGGGGERAGGGR